MKTILLVMLSLIPAYSFSAEFKVLLTTEKENAKGQFITYADEYGNPLTQTQVDQILSKNSHKTITQYVLVPARRSIKGGFYLKAKANQTFSVDGSVIGEKLDTPNDHYDNTVETLTVLVTEIMTTGPSR